MFNVLRARDSRPTPFRFGQITDLHDFYKVQKRRELSREVSASRLHNGDRGDLVLFPVNEHNCRPYNRRLLLS